MNAYHRSALALLLIFMLAPGVIVPAVEAAPPLTPTQQATRDPRVPITYVNSPPVSHQYTLTLITGDTLYISRQGNGPWSVAIREAPRPGGHTTFEAFTDSRLGTYVVPVDVSGLLSNVLDPTFFNLDYLVANHLTDDQTPLVSAIVQYASNAPVSSHWSPSLVKASDLTIIHSQAISFRKNQAAEFGKSLLQPDTTQSLMGIQKIWLDRIYTAVDDQSTPLIGADIARKVLGFDGSGVKIAIIDTGIDKTHPDLFFPNGTSKIIEAVDFECSVQPISPSECDSITNDLFGHGTHVAGIAAGTGAASAGLYIGVAPGASLMNMKVLNRFGYGYDSWIIAGMQSAALGLNGTRADVISMSLGDGATDGSDPMSQAVNSLTASTGIPFVIAAGNAGAYGAVAAPGASSAAITVAASSKIEPVTIAYFSSRGPRAVDFSVKPDIAAPGLSIISSCSSTAIVLRCPSGSKYLTLSGTSMATPHVAGSAALLIQAARKSGKILTSGQIKNILQSSSRILQSGTGQPDIDIYQQGSGLVRIDRAITSNITFTPAEISFGLVPYNTTTTLQATFQVLNRGLTNQSITLTSQMFDVPSSLSPLSTGASYNNLITIDKPSFTLTPNAAIVVTLTIDAMHAPYQKLWTLFSGRIIATSSTGEQEHAIFGFTKEGPRQTLHISGINPDGSPAAFQQYTIFDSADQLGIVRFFQTLDNNGQASLRIPLSTYNLVMDDFFFPTSSGKTLFEYFRISATEFSVSSTPVSIVLDARTAGAVSLNLQANPSATVGLQQVGEYNYIRSDGSSDGYLTFPNGFVWDLFAENRDTAHLGTLWTFDEWLRTTSPAVNSTVLYDITQTRKQQGPGTYTITSQNLTSTTGLDQVRIHADIATTMHFGRFATPTSFMFGIAMAEILPVNAPIIRNEYQQASQAVFREFVLPGPGIFWFDTAFRSNFLGFQGFLGKIWSPGETFTESFFEQPLTPTILGALVDGSGALELAGFKVEDPFGHFGLFTAYTGVTFTMRIYINNALSQNLTSLPDQFLVITPLPSTPASIKVIMQMNPDPSWSILSQRTQTTLSFTASSTIQGTIQLPNSHYSVKGLNLHNQVATTMTSTMTFITISLSTPTGAPFNATTATVQASTNDGTSWFNAKSFSISSGSISTKILVPTVGSGPFYVSILIHAQSADGTTLDQQIIRAVQLVPGAQPP